MSRAGRPSSAPVLATLKGFQRDTVEYVFRRLFLDTPSRDRFLVADEVGLGKTLVARGVIARAVEHLWDSVGRIDVVYVCSNADIARQNINRLRIPGASEFTLASRLTMLPWQVRDLQHSRLNFISLTPGTSFDQKSKLGRWEERALLYLLLEKAWRFKGTGPLNLFQGGKSRKKFRSAVAQFRESRPVDPELAARFLEELEQQPGLRDLCRDLIDRFAYSRKHIPKEDRVARRQLIGELRGCLAATCVEALEPDLVILDEFQRFRDLLDDESDAADLARRLFEWSRGEERARVLLLSATPYKMYTQAHERDTDDHYQDFLRTLRFLAPERGDVERFDTVLRAYRTDMYQIGDGDGRAVEHTKAELERLLRDVMVRTERLAVSSDRNGMLRDATVGGVHLEPGEVLTYRSLHRLATCLDHPDPVEFWKSAPYLLSFMDGYQLKDRLERDRENPAVAPELAAILSDADGLSLSEADLESYKELDPRNARLRWLIGRTVDRGAWRMLWAPASLPYYRPRGVWADATASDFTKSLVFSSWRVVPRMVAAMVSYAAERATVKALHGERVSWSRLRERFRGPLRFNVRDGRPAGMSAMTVIYPSLALAELVDPLAGADGDRTLHDVREEAVGTLRKALSGLDRAGQGAPDERWYWAAPILLDIQADPEAAWAYWEDDELARIWSAGSGDAEDRGWSAHVRQARELREYPDDLGAMPSDLPEVLADVALGAPGVVALRALRRIGRPLTLAERVIALHEAAAIGWTARNLFNVAETVALMRGINPAEPYWHRVVEYCVSGNLQAVMDEYAHVLVEALGLTGWTSRRVITEVAQGIREAMSLRTTNPGFDVVASEGATVSVAAHRIRTRFAHQFGGQRERDGDGVRADQLRHAFNSPFWPFVLATTSVGQEGLDFHQYCHAVVHWNLPSNPVDLEQREGRVHRYKGHAVRRTVAARHRRVLADGEGGDPWIALFQAAATGRNEESELIPYWVHGDPEGVRIERHVPVLPLSRDVLRFEQLRKSLALYRMVFGQPRQADLVAYLADRLSVDEARERLEALRIDLTPPQATTARQSVTAEAETPQRPLQRPAGPIGMAVIDVLDQYPLVVGRKTAGRNHPVAELLRAVTRELDEAALVEDDRCSWEFDCEYGPRWLPVPGVWLCDERPRRARTDLVVELLLDAERDGVHVALGLAFWDGENAVWVPRQKASRYRDRRRGSLEGVLERLIECEFVPVPASEFLRGADGEKTSAVALCARFLPRDVLATDEAILGAAGQVLDAYDFAHEAGVSKPRPSVRRLVLS